MEPKQAERDSARLRHGWLHRIPVAAAFVLFLLPMLYIAAYLALLDAGPRDAGIAFSLPEARGTMTYIGPPDYKIGGGNVQTFFYPAYFIDSRYIRRNSWSYVLLPWEGDDD